MKRLFDIAAASVGLVLTAPLLAAAAVLVRLDSPGPVIFSQERMGRGFRPFRIYKFRTMRASNGGELITSASDPRVTRAGRLLRRLKIDELPQLFNVLRGDMSLVGPRPEVRRYVELFRSDYEHILQVRPGITDLASIGYRNESELLDRASNPEAEYVTHILPDKIRLARIYLARSGMRYDLTLIAATLACLATGRNWAPDRAWEPRLRWHRPTR